MPEPTPIRSAPAADARRRELLFALRVANVPNATADTVVNQHLCDDFYGYVHFLCTEKWKDGGAGGTPVTERITTSVYFRRVGLQARDRDDIPHVSTKPFDVSA
jgi:hypothetical protein